MACCGGRRGGRGSRGSNPHPVSVNEPGDTVILEYTGTKQGTMSRRGAVTKEWYTFSAAPVNKRFACAKADAGHLLRMGDLVIVKREQPPPVAPPPMPAPMQAPPIPAPIPKVRPVEQPSLRAPVSLEEEPPADDLSQIKGITLDTAGILPLVGLRTFADLATLTAQGVTRVAQLTGKSEGHVENWREQARELAGGGKSDGDGPGGGSPGDLGADLPDDV